MPQRPLPLPASPLVYVAAALLYMLATDMGASYLLDLPSVYLFRPESGVALALLLLGGLRLAASILVGAFLAHALTPGLPVAVAASQALASATAALLGAWLLQHVARLDLRESSFRNCHQLLAYAGVTSTGAGALTAATALLASGQISASEWPHTVLHWWMGNALGTVLVGTLALACWHAWTTRNPLPRIAEGLLLYGLAFAAGQVIFGDSYSALLDPIASGYWMFIFITWAGVRLGLLGTAGLLCMVALQALWGTIQGVGFFAFDIADSHGFGYWSYMVILSLVGLSLAAYCAERQRQNASLRIAAIAFECQEGLLITDPHHAILQANQSFLTMSGYAAHEVLGRAAHFLRAPPPDGSELPSPDAASPHALQRQEWHRRKSGAIYPAWVGITPVLDRQSRTTHHVWTMTDITQWHEQKELQREREQAHRDALVREVHHRIKNNLQGILGVVHGFGQAHPQLREPVHQLIGQVQSIAVIHGLQGRASTEQVRLCELTTAVAAGLESLWQVPVALDIPENWLPCRLRQTEAVPVALVLNELILNAIKHGGQAHRDVRVVLRKGQHPDIVQVTISNTGQWHATTAQAHTGLDLVAALMPRSGAVLSRQQIHRQAVAQLVLQPPVIELDSSP